MALLAAVLSGPLASARAQLPDPPPNAPRADVLRAREAFLRGMEFAGEQRFEDARREFVHSYALSGSPVALFNLASTLRSLERHREAAEALERLLADAGLEASVRAQAEPMYAEVAARVGRLRLRGALDGATCRVDLEPPRRLEGEASTVIVEPGPHELVVERHGAEPFTWTGRVGAGEALDLRVELEPTSRERDRPAAPDDSGLWVGVGVSLGAVLVLVAIVVGVVLDAEAQLGPRTPFVLELP